MKSIEPSLDRQAGNMQTLKSLVEFFLVRLKSLQEDGSREIYTRSGSQEDDLRFLEMAMKLQSESLSLLFGLFYGISGLSVDQVGHDFTVVINKLVVDTVARYQKKESEE